MMKGKSRVLLAALLAVLLLVTVLAPLDTALAATGSPELSNLSVSVKQNGADIAQSGTLDSTKPVSVKVDFGVPVEGDGGASYFEHGDTVTLVLSESFHFDPVPSSEIDLMFGSKQLGTVTLSNNGQDQATATITFDGDEDIFDPEAVPAGEPVYSQVSGEFEVGLAYNGAYDTGDDGTKTVTILDKTYTLHVPGDVTTYSVTKTGTPDWSAGTVIWEITVTGEKDTTPATPIDLAGYVLKDDLSGAGAYVADSFTPAGAGTLTAPDAASQLLTYTFPAGSESPQTVTYQTTIPENILTNGGSLWNGAGLYQNDTQLAVSNTASVTVESPAVTKWGETTDSSGGATYDPASRTITWYVQVDPKGRTLEDLTITDQLKDGLTFASAQWQKLDGSTWTDVSGKNWTSAPTDGQYAIGDVDYTGRLAIVTRVPDPADGVSVTAKTYHNQASAAWTGGGADTGNPGVSIGYNALTKTGTQSETDKAGHQITWTLKTDMKGQSTANFKVYDLFAPDKNTSDADLTGASAWPAGLAIGSDGVVRNNGQKFVAVSAQATGLTVTPIELQDSSGKTLGTLVEISGLSGSGDNQVVLKSQVTDPDVLAGNGQNQWVNNTAGLFKDTTLRANAGNGISIDNSVLSKQLLKRVEAANDHAGQSINPGNTGSASEGFDYQHKEAIFRLNVNGAGLDFNGVETTLSAGYGAVTVTDTLPAGWTFKTFSGGTQYLIYDVAGTLLTNTGFVTADFTGETADGRKTATFTFADLNQPYVILVKAGPTDDTFRGYLAGADVQNETNNLSLSTTGWTPGVPVSAVQQVQVDSKVLNKTFSIPSQGVLTWQVDYTPCESGIGTGVEDTLPQGIDLRTDCSGNLLWEQSDGTSNITVTPLTLNADGSYTAGTPLSPAEVQQAVTYDCANRTLKFTFPDRDQAYRLNYVTDVTGVPGSVSNPVKLVDASGAGASTQASYTVTEQDGWATMGRSAYLVVKKTGMSGNLLSGAEFTLYNTNADGTRASARAVRTTGTDGLVKFYGLASGEYILVETGLPGSDYRTPALSEYRVTVSDNLKTTVNGSAPVTASSPFAVVNYRTTDLVGSLTIAKTVAGNAADTTKTFDFTVRFGAAGTYDYIGNGVPDGTITSGGTISLAHGQSITIVGLPAGTTYSVTEADYTADGYQTTSTGETGAIEADTTQTASFTNTRSVYVAGKGNLTVSKTVTGDGAEPDRKFDFTVTLTNAPGAYLYTGAASGTLRSGDTVSLAGGESVTLTGLPEGAGYTVTEADYTADGYTMAAAGASGTITAGGTQTAAFTNRRDSVPEETETPTGPGMPTDPGDPEGNIDETGVPGGAMNGGSAETGTGMPRTGDTQTGSLARIGVIVFALALAALAGADLLLRRAYVRKKRK